MDEKITAELARQISDEKSPKLQGLLGNIKNDASNGFDSTIVFNSIRFDVIRELMKLGFDVSEHTDGFRKVYKISW